MQMSYHQEFSTAACDLHRNRLGSLKERTKFHLMVMVPDIQLVCLEVYFGRNSCEFVANLAKLTYALFKKTRSTHTITWAIAKGHKGLILAAPTDESLWNKLIRVIAPKLLGSV
jgi:hypothetical protein